MIEKGGGGRGSSSSAYTVEGVEDSKRELQVLDRSIDELANLGGGAEATAVVEETATEGATATC